MIFKRCLAVYLVFVSILTANGQLLSPGITHISREEGLGHNQVECIFQDSYGFMWFGTRNGLSRYDGYEFRTYRTSNDSGSISGNRIMSIAEDNEGNLWIGTFQHGVNKYHRRTGSFSRLSATGDLGNRINRVNVLNDGSVWICTNNGLAKYDAIQDTVKIFLPDENNPAAINSNQVFDIIQTRTGEIYVATWSYAIQRFDPDKETFTDVFYQRSPNLNIDYRKRIVEDLDGNLWISANQHGISMLNPRTGKSKLYTSENSGLQTDVLNGDMMFDQDGRLWIATDGKGVNVFDLNTGKFQYLSDLPDADMVLPGNQVYSIYKDMQNHIWIGFFDKGVAHYDPNSIKFNKTLFRQDDLMEFVHKSILALFQDSKGEIWVGTDGDGIFSVDEKAGIRHFMHDPEKRQAVSSNVITSIGEDPQGNILAGTYAAGFNIFNPVNQTWKNIYQGPTNTTVNSSSVWEICTDSRGKVWLGLLGNGVDYYNSSTGIYENLGLSSQNAISVNHPNVMVIMEDADGDIWFGTEGNGVNILDRQSGRMSEPQVKDENSDLQKSMIRSLYQDRKGKMWIGTEGNGLFIYSKRTGETINLGIEDGLPDMIVHGIQEDNRGNVWITTGNGLTMYNPLSGQWQDFYTSDGLTANEFNSDAILQLNDGRILAGSINGLDLIDPTSMIFNQNIPRVVLTKLEILNEDVQPGDLVNNRVVLSEQITYLDYLELKHSDKIFSIEFAALNYSHPEKCEFQYMLEGFDKQWVNTSSARRMATYSNLDPGEYIFKVKASNSDGKWGYNTRELHIEVLPPFWLTWWFISLLIVTFLLALTYIYRTRLNAYKNSFFQKQAIQEKRIIELEKQNLELELKKLTFSRVQRNRNLLDLKNRISGISVKARDNVKASLEDVIAEIDNEISSDKDWKIIEPQIDATYNNFLTKLRNKHEDLTNSELKIAAYIRMNLSTKEISEYMHKTSRAIENDRHRLRKKLSLSASDSLRKYLSTL